MTDNRSDLQQFRDVLQRNFIDHPPLPGAHSDTRFMHGFASALLAVIDAADNNATARDAASAARDRFYQTMRHAWSTEVPE